MLLKQCKILRRLHTYMILKRFRFNRDLPNNYPCDNCKFVNKIKLGCILFEMGRTEVKNICLREFENLDFSHINYIYHPDDIQEI